MTVATNMAAVARFGNPFRLYVLGDQSLLATLREGENEHEDNDSCREEYYKHSCYSSQGMVSYEEGGEFCTVERKEDGQCFDSLQV